MKIIKRIGKKIVMVFSLFACILTAFCSSVNDGQISVKAESEGTKYSKSYVMDDLEGMTIDGEEFDISDYGFNEWKSTEVLQFVEYCYSYESSRQANYGLYVYVYNPQGLHYVDSTLDAISMRFGGVSSDLYRKYPLKLLSVCDEKANQRLFYKYEVVLTASQKSDILSKVKSSKRVYEVADIELMIVGGQNATAYEVGTYYEFSGYAKGYGPKIEEESTLEMKSSTSQTLTLDVFPASYTPKGPNGKTLDTYDTLHSVYFAIPKTIEQEYGYMSAVHARWLSAYLAPYIATNHTGAYHAFSPYLGEKVDKWTLDVDYMFVGRDYSNKDFDKTTHHYGFLFNDVTSAQTSHGNTFVHSYYGWELDYLYSIYLTSNNVVASQDIINELKASVNNYGGKLVQDKYAACMFEKVDEDYTDINVLAGDTYTLVDQKLTTNFWKNILSNNYFEVSSTTAYSNISAIQAITEKDVTGSYEADWDNLYISEADYSDFCEFYNAKKAENTVYLFRYRQTETIKQSATLYEYEAGLFGAANVYSRDSVSAFVQNYVDLDFDVIDVTMTGVKGDTVIGVVSSPMDIAPSIKIPFRNGNYDWKSLVILLCIVLAVVFIWTGLCVRFPFLGTLTNYAIKILTSPIWGPFWLIGYIVKKIRGDYD